MVIGSVWMYKDNDQDSFIVLKKFNYESMYINCECVSILWCWGRVTVHFVNIFDSARQIA